MSYLVSALQLSQLPVFWVSKNKPDEQLQKNVVRGPNCVELGSPATIPGYTLEPSEFVFQLLVNEESCLLEE